MSDKYFAIGIQEKHSIDKNTVYLSSSAGQLIPSTDGSYADTLASGNVYLFVQEKTAMNFLSQTLAKKIMKVTGRSPVVIKMTCKMKGYPVIDQDAEQCNECLPGQGHNSPGADRNYIGVTRIVHGIDNQGQSNSLADLDADLAGRKGDAR